MDQETKQYLDRINKKLSVLIEAQKKETWVTVGWIMDITGWDGERLRRARDQGIVKVRKDGGHMLYLLESIPPQFITKQTA